MIETYEAWCAEHTCSHGHCPLDCEHPQPFVANGTLYCGRCWFRDSQLTEMIPCKPHVCLDA